MDPIVALALAIGAGLSTVAGTLVEKGVVEPALQPLIERTKNLLQKDYWNVDRQQKVVKAFDAALDEAAKASQATDLQKYQLRVALLRIAQPGNEALRDEVMRSVLLVASLDDARWIPDSLPRALGLPTQQKQPLAQALYFLHQHLYALEELRKLFDLAEQRTVVTLLRQMQFDFSRVADVVDPTWNPTLYFESLLIQCGRLPLRLLGTRQLKSDKPITLDEVYTDLDVEETINLDQAHIRAKRLGELPTGTEWEAAARGELRRLTALEAVSFDDQPRVVLLGYPGSGKSAFIKLLAFCLVKEQLELGAPGGLLRLQGWTQGALVPVRVILRELVAWADGAKLIQASTQTLWEYIAFEMKQHGFEEDFRPLKRHLQQHGGLILLDGLDEVREADRRREFIKAVIENFVQDNPRCRFIVTCRPYAYKNEEWRLDRFRPYTLAPFNRDQIEHFIRLWYQIVGVREDWPDERVDGETADLIRQTQRRDLQEFARKPLLLTMMARLHAIEGHLPEDRAKLYERTVNLLLDEWQSEKGGGLSAFGLKTDEVAQVMNRVAFEAHKRQGAHADRGREALASISDEDLRREFKSRLHLDDNRVNEIIAYIQTRAGLLDAHDSHTYSFPHRSFQEYLAARDLLRDNDADIAELTRADREWWREVFLFTALSASLKEAVNLIDALCFADKPSAPIQAEEAYAALIAAQAAAEIHLPASARTPRFQHTLAKLRDWLVAIIQQQVLPLAEHAEAGRVLSALGEPREEVKCPIPFTVPVPAGEFIMGGDKYDEKPQHRVKLDDFRIGKYPVTHAQFRRFVDDGGYTDKWKQCWTEAGWKWRASNEISKPDYWDDPEWNLDNHPVVGVSWYEAVAFCNWLTKTNPEGRTFRLPMEAEWEKAARGTDGREFPWEGEFDPAKANTNESEINRTTAVGLFPLGASPYGALDMAGNVWEWCSSIGYYQYKETGPEEDGSDSLEGDAARAQRGGSWPNLRDYARCSLRLRRDPADRYYYLGFRVVQSALP